ncbi:hypothetical protein ATCCBAA256_19730 [Mycobacterium montefiorense]|nr:hypothetical protein ATCCBAA256_19730 [Mycobacterium montefiorense]
MNGQKIIKVWKMAQPMAVARAGDSPSCPKNEARLLTHGTGGKGQPPGLSHFDTGHAKPLVYCCSHWASWSIQDGYCCVAVVACWVVVVVVAAADMICGAGVLGGTAASADSLTAS